MTPRPMPVYEVRVQKLDGVPYSSHTLIVQGHIVRSQLAPFDADELEALIRMHLAPEPVPAPAPFHYGQARKRKGEPRVEDES